MSTHNIKVALNRISQVLRALLKGNFIAPNLHCRHTLHIKAALKQKNARLLMAIQRHAIWLKRPTWLTSCCVLSQSLGALTKRRKATISFVTSVRPSVCLCTRMDQPDSHWTDLHHSFRARFSQWYWWTLKSSRMLCRLVYSYRIFQAAQCSHLGVKTWLLTFTSR